MLLVLVMAMVMVMVNRGTKKAQPSQTGAASLQENSMSARLAGQFPGPPCLAIGDQADQSCYSVHFLSTMLALVPPKPKELQRAYSHSTFAAVLAV